jgi:hypothetical protein
MQALNHPKHNTSVEPNIEDGPVENLERLLEATGEKMFYPIKLMFA